jgi:hypothetical protein
VIKHLWKRWKIVAKKIGDFQARVILSILYFVAIGPFALIVRWGADPLSLKTRAQPSWRPKAETQDPAIKRALNQF